MYFCCLPPIFNLPAILTKKKKRKKATTNKNLWPYGCAKSLANQQDSSMSLQILAAFCRENDATLFLGTSAMESTSSWCRLFILGESLQHFHLVSPPWALPGLLPRQWTLSHSSAWSPIYRISCYTAFITLEGIHLIKNGWISSRKRCNSFISCWLLSGCRTKHPSAWAKYLWPWHIMSEEWPKPGQECVHHYYYISMQVFNVLMLSRNKEMHRKCSLHGYSLQCNPAGGVGQYLQPCTALVHTAKRTGRNRRSNCSQEFLPQHEPGLHRGWKSTSRNILVCFQPETTISSFSLFPSVISSFCSNITKFYFEMNHCSNTH